MAKNQSELNLTHRALRRGFHLLIQALGVATLIMLTLALTPLPSKVQDWLAGGGDALVNGPDVIVMMGGGGIPSETGLMRCFAVGVQAHRFPKARVVVAMPFEPDETDGVSRVMNELIGRGVERGRITQASKGHHSREQAQEVWKLLDGERKQPTIQIVSSPEHIRRSVMAFRKAGFKTVGGAPAYGYALKADLSLPREGRLPDPAQTVLFRYRFWGSLSCEVRVLRELAALCYYRIKGWA